MLVQADLNGLPLVIHQIQATITKHPLPLVFLLQGGLASGKTTLVQHFCQTLNAPCATSPTFSLLHIYQAPSLCIYHYDFYLKSLPEIVGLGILEHLDLEGVHFIEWGSVLEDLLARAGFRVFKIKCTRSQQGCLYEMCRG